MTTGGREMSTDAGASSRPTSSRSWTGRSNSFRSSVLYSKPSAPRSL